MKKLYTAIIILLLLISSGTHAQQRGTPDSLLVGWRLSTNLMTLVDPDAGISLAVENRYRKNWGILLEGTWIFLDRKGDFDMRGRYTPMAKGFRIRPEIRFYMGGRSRRYKLFFAQEVSYKRVTYLEEWISEVRSTPNSSYADYEKISVYEKLKQSYGTSGKVGFQVFFDKKTNRAMFELYVGLGVLYRDVRFKKDPPPYGSYLEDNSSYFIEQPKTGWDVNVPLGFKLGYRF